MKINRELRRMEYQLVPCITAAQTADVQELAHEIWHAHYPGIIAVEQIDYMLESNYSKAALKKQIQEGQELFIIALEEEKPAGFIGVYRREGHELFLSKFYIKNDLHGRGIGRQSFALLLRHFPDIRIIRLQVNRQNIKAINFYFSLGFRIERCADFDIGNGYFMNDFIMRFQRADT
jgi:ribosomal protein S18 acetylase RimI-like enzyme